MNDEERAAGEGTAANRIRAVSTPGGRVFVDEEDRGSVARALLAKGKYEKPWTRWIESAVHPGMHTLDIGANIGYYTALLATRVGPTGSVIACEPDPHNCELLARTIDENGFIQVRLVRAAVSDRAGSAVLYQDAAWHGVHSLAADNCVNPSDRTTQVPTVTIDRLMADGHARLDFAKIDAQGAEGRILAGATSLLGQRHATVLIEIWPHGLETLGSSVLSITQPFLQHGFTPYRLEDAALVPIAPDAIQTKAAGLGRWSSFNLVWEK